MMSFRAAASATTATTAVAATAAAAAASRTRTRCASSPSDVAKNTNQKKSNNAPSRRSVFMAGSASAAVRPLLRLAGSGAAAAAGSGAINLVARASSGGSDAGATSEIAKVLLDPKYPDEYPFG